MQTEQTSAEAASAAAVVEATTLGMTSTIAQVFDVVLVVIIPFPGGLGLFCGSVRDSSKSKLSIGQLIDIISIMRIIEHLYLEFKA
uniref:Uncharacterized protein n=1 Tax=Cannabis sativa TaxID=3483 RepID=A0A803P3A6_CANSA